MCAKENLGDFQRVNDPKETEAFFKELSFTTTPLTIWEKSRDSLIKSRLIHVNEDDNLLHVWIPPEFDIRKFIRTLEGAKDFSCFFNIPLQSAIYFFRVLYLGVDKHGFLFEMPAKIFKVQRRSHLRFNVPRDFGWKVELPNEPDPLHPFVGKLINISEGGMAFILRTVESSTLAIGQIIDPLKFSILSRKFSVRAEVRQLMKQPPDSNLHGVKVGVKFEELDTADREWLSKLVNEESKKVFARISQGS